MKYRKRVINVLSDVREERLERKRWKQKKFGENELGC